MRPLLISLSAVALVLAACSGESGESADERAAGVINRAVVAARANDAATVERFLGALPQGLPVRPPIYSDADIIVSSRIVGPLSAVQEEDGEEAEAVSQTALYFIVLDTGDERERVFAFYEAALDRDPWQLDSSVSLRDLDRLDFFDVEDLDIAGTVQIVPSQDGDRTSIFISLQDAGARLESEPPFDPGESLPLLNRFPEQVPQYPNAIITSTAFERSPTIESFLLIFLTTDSQDEVVAFYQEQFDLLGWTVQEREAVRTEERLSFQDETGVIEGDLLADLLTRDDSYTEVVLRLRVTGALEPADGATATPEPEP